MASFATLATALLAGGALAAPHTPFITQGKKVDYAVQFDPRPWYIINNMTESPLKAKLQTCENGPFSISAWSIGHRGGTTLQIPEETEENTIAGARMGAGVLECDVAFTSDRKLVCRHSQCDLHTTTDILLRPELAAKCTKPFTPANDTASASALCCTSDITEAEFSSLCAKMDGSNSSATTPEDYQFGTPTWRTSLYDTCGKILTLNEWIDLTDSLPGYRNFTPELKTPPASVPMPFNGYTQEQYASDLPEAFLAKGVNPDRVFLQSFTEEDVFQWIDTYPAFGKHAVLLDESGDAGGAELSAAAARLPELKARGVNIIAPPTPYLLAYGDATNSTIVPSEYAITAKAAGLDIIAWSYERSPPLKISGENEDYYYFTVADAIKYDGQLYEILNILANDIGIVGLFSDWASTTTYFANCFGLHGTYGEKYT
jgi:glycerophosphoryl diester phosphodiesterase